MAGTPPSNPERYGHIAELLANYLSRTGVSRTQLSRQIGGSSSVISVWMSARAAPSLKFRLKLAKLLGVPVEELAARRKTPGDREVLGPARQALALAQPASTLRVAASAVIAPEPPARDLFRFAIRSDGQVSLELKIVVPAARGMALARLLMDAGIAPNDEHEHGHEE